MKIKLSKIQWEEIGKTAGWTKEASNRTNEAFYCLLAGMPTEDVTKRYQLQQADWAELDNMIEVTGKGLSLEELRKRIKKESLPTAYQGLWDKYNQK